MVSWAFGVLCCLVTCGFEACLRGAKAIAFSFSVVGWLVLIDNNNIVRF